MPALCQVGANRLTTCYALAVSKPLPISVVIAAYNEEKCIGRCVRALQPQLQPGDEIIVVDNNSTDKTAELAEELGARIVREPKQGLSFARNKGFDSAKNTILARTDADSVACPDWLATIRDYYTTSGDHVSRAVTGPVYLTEFLPFKWGVHQGIGNQTLGHETLVGSNEALTKALWKKIKPKLSNNDQLYAEDVEMAAIITRSGGEVVFLPKMRVNTSARWMIRHPIASTKRWKRKLKHTKQLLGIKN